MNPGDELGQSSVHLNTEPIPTQGHDFPSWAVWRQDDSGTQFLLAANLTETQAKAVVADFESKGHKQTYWCQSERACGKT